MISIGLQLCRLGSLESSGEPFLATGPFTCSPLELPEEGIFGLDGHVSIRPSSTPLQNFLRRGNSWLCSRILISSSISKKPFHNSKNSSPKTNLFSSFRQAKSSKMGFTDLVSEAGLTSTSALCRSMNAERKELTGLPSPRQVPCRQVLHRWVGLLKTPKSVA